MSIFTHIISLYLIILDGRGVVRDTQVTDAQAMQIYTEANEYYKRAGYRLRLDKFIRVRDPAPEYGKSELNLNRLLPLYDYAKTHHWLMRKRIVHFITPRSINGGFMYGWNLQRCGRWSGDNVSYSTGQYVNTANAVRIHHSGVGMAHESGHALGCHHVKSETLMNAAPLQLYEKLQKPLDWDLYSLAEMKRCNRIGRINALRRYNGTFKN